MWTWSKWLLAGGLSIVFAGVVLVHAAMTSAVLTGILFAAAGGVQIVVGITDAGLWTKVWNVCTGMMMMVLGLSFVTNPFDGAVSLAAMVVVLVAASGGLRMALAWQMRHSPFFWSMMVSGGLSVLLAVLLLADFAAVSQVLLGGLLGIELVINGAGLLVLALFVRLGLRVSRST